MGERTHGIWCWLKKVKAIATAATAVVVLLGLIIGYMVRLGGRVEKAREKLNSIPDIKKEVKVNTRDIVKLDKSVGEFAIIIGNIDKNVTRILNRMDRRASR